MGQQVDLRVRTEKEEEGQKVQVVVGVERAEKMRLCSGTSALLRPLVFLVPIPAVP